jgi:DNA mismatch endonuclease (patch repair protein)
MADKVSRDKRSRMMAGIKNRDTKPELLVRKELFRRGVRYRLHNTKLPGKPDIVLARYHAVIFVHGCFWHGHGCSLFKWPQTQPGFWQDKISGNAARDSSNLTLLHQAGWRTLVIWECALKGKRRMDIQCLVERVLAWLRHGETALEIRGGDEF